MPHQSKTLDMNEPVLISDGLKPCHVKAGDGQNFLWVESVDKPATWLVRNGTKHNDVYFPKGWVIWAISSSNHVPTVVSINTPSGE